MKKQVIVIGGGASGLAAAIMAKTNHHSVLLLERNHDCGKKLSMTGNGRCNYYNQDQDLSHYHTTEQEVLKEIITEENQKSLLTFFDEIGLVPRIREGYYYPYSNQASSVTKLLKKKAEELGVQTETDCLAQTIVKKSDKFYLETTKGPKQADVVILAAGSKAYTKTGSDGSSYELAQRLGHTILPVLPSLTFLKGQEKALYKIWAGVRSEAILTLYENGQVKKVEQGEIQLTKEGISGICTFNLSRFVAHGLLDGTKEEIKINFLPCLEKPTKEIARNFFEERNHKLKNRTLAELLEGILKEKLITVILKKAHLRESIAWQELSMEEQDRFLEILLAFPFSPIQTGDYEQAQVCQGGIPLKEINCQTMESKKVKGLFLVGELLDVDGDCGGYNLTFAFLSGILAGKGIK